MIELFREMARRRDRGERVAVATIIRTKGSTPRELGAKMLVTQGGAILGTIGGGYAEHEVWKAAREVIEEGQPRLVHLELTSEVATDEGAICGGILDVFVEAVGGR